MRIIHLLNWNFKSIESILSDIKKQSFDAIQINCVQPLKEDDVFHWWLSYQPLGFRIGNMYGSKDDLISLCNKAKSLGIKIIVDVVLNHMANKSDKECLIPHPTVDLELREQKEFWKPQKMLTDGDNRMSAVTELIGLPGLDLKNKKLRKIVFRFLNELKACGVSGFRFDAAKHIGLPNDGVIFFDEVASFLIENNLIGYGEFLGGNEEWRNEFVDVLPILSPYTSKINDIERMFTFIESHDTFLNDCYDSTRNISTNELCNLYSLLNYKYSNTLWYARPINAPYSPWAKKNDDIILDPLSNFELTFLTDKRIKEANEINPVEYQKTKVLSKKR